MTVHTVAACPGCGSEESSRVELAHEHELRRCQSCSLVYASHYADPSEIYVDGYLTGETDYGLDIFDPVFQDFLEFAASKRLDVIEQVAAPTRGSMLDVGCGAGEVLNVAAARGWEVAGAEPVADSAEIARKRGLDVRTALLEESGLAEGSWDVVTAFHVLEHLPDGRAFLGLLARWARPGGLVVVEVPNWDSVDRSRHGPRWSGLRPLEHIAHYGPSTLRSTFENAGLEPVLVRSMGFLWERQSVAERLANLGLSRWRRALRPFSRTVDRNGKAVRVPGGLVNRGLLATQALYDRRGVGQVVLGVARVPS